MRPVRFPLPPSRGRSRGFTLVEILIALAVLQVALVFFVYAVRGRRTENEKTQGYFNAVWLTQKAIDDLDHRSRENPYMIDEFAGKSQDFPVLDPAAPLFRFTEDSSGDGRLDNDRLMRDLPERDRQRLAPYSVAVRFDRAFGNGLALATVTTRWDENGRPQTFELKHLLSDLPRSVEFDPMDPPRIAVTEPLLLATFFDEEGLLPDLLIKYGVARELLEPLAQVACLSRGAATELAANLAAIAARQAAADGRTADGLEAVAGLHEKNALLILRTYAGLALPFSGLAALDARGGLAFGGLFRNRKASALIPDFARIATEALGLSNASGLSLAFNNELAQALNLNLRIATDPAVSAAVSYRRRSGAAQRAADLAVALAQNGADGVTVTVPGPAGERKLSLETFALEALVALRKAAEGRDYNRAARLAHAIEAIKTRTFPEFQDLSGRLDNMNAVAALATAYLKRMSGLVQAGTIYYGR